MDSDDEFGKAVEAELNSRGLKTLVTKTNVSSNAGHKTVSKNVMVL